MITEEINIEDKKENEISKIEECLVDGLTIRQTSMVLYGDISKEHIDLITNVLKRMRNNRKISKKSLYSKLSFEYETQDKIYKRLFDSILDEHYNLKTGKYEDVGSLLYKLERASRLLRQLNIDIYELVKWSDAEPELINEIKKHKKSSDIINISI